MLVFGVVSGQTRQSRDETQPGAGTPRIALHRSISIVAFSYLRRRFQDWKIRSKIKTGWWFQSFKYYMLFSPQYGLGK